MCDSVIIEEGKIRPLTPEERERWESSGYCWVTLSQYRYKYRGITVTVPPGFLTDGSSGGPDYGTSWIFHDWLYATHRFDERECTREEADRVMSTVLGKEKLSWYLSAFNLLSYFNPMWAFSRAWYSSGERGPEYLLFKEL